MNIALMIIYVIAAVAGSTLIKLGSDAGMKTVFIVPFVNMHISLVSILGVLAYGLSFVTYIVLLTRFDLSFVSPLLVGFVYVFLMITAFAVFKESMTLYKLIGCGLILIGIVLVLLKK